MTTEARTTPQIHVRYEGHSYDISLDLLDVGVGSTDAQIRSAVAAHLNAPLTKLNQFLIDRHEESNELTLRPQAVFG
jgi:hypothetical protein